MRTFNKIFLTSLFLFSFIQGYAQDSYRVIRTWESRIFMESFSYLGASNWAAGGAGLANAHQDLAAYNNPAALPDAGFHVETGASKRLKTDWHSDINRDGQYLLPAYLSLSSTYKQMVFAFGYYRAYDYRVTAQAEISTVSNPDGTGEKWDLENCLVMHSGFGSAAYRYNDVLSLGVTVVVNHLRQDEKIFRSEAGGSGTGYSLITGVLIQPIDNLSLAYTFKSFSEVDYDVKMKSEPLLMVVEPGRYDGDDNYSYAPVGSITSQYRARFPFIFETGISYQAFSSLKLMAKIDFQNWSRVHDNNNDKINYYLGAEFSALKSLGIGVGFFTKQSPNSDTGEYMDQKFLSAGFRWMFMENINLSASWVGSEMFASEKYENNRYWGNKQFSQNVFLAGLSFSLNKQN